MPLHFVPFDESHLHHVRPYFATQTDRFCDWTVGTAYMWRHFFAFRTATVAGCLIPETRYIDGQHYFSYPLGDGDKSAALTALEEHSAAAGSPLQFCSVSPADTARLAARYGSDRIMIHPQPDFYDYLYHYHDLATFAGRRYSGQRNHIHQFLKRYPNWEYAPLTSDRIPAVLRFLDDLEMHSRAAAALTPMEQADLSGSRDLLKVMDAIGMTGGCILVDGQIAAFAVGERQGDTLYTHIEKGDRRYVGIYPLMVREYAAHNGGEGLLYINREDDAGDPGLRQSKQAYRPCSLLEKNLVIIKER